MLPSLFINYHTDRGIVCAKFMPNCYLCHSFRVKIAHFANLRLAKKSVWVRRAIGMASPFFSISHIIQLCSGIQMIWVYAQWRIASVQHKQPCRDRSLNQFECCSVCPNGLMVSIENTVSVFVLLSQPQPATSCFVNRIPETDLVLATPKSIVARTRAVPTLCQMAWLHAKRAIAIFAIREYFQPSQDLNLPYRSVLRSGSFIASTVCEPKLF